MAIEAATRADEMQARGEMLGPLHGLPVAHKDLINTRGIRTTFGSPLFKDNVPAEDDILVERMRRAGAIIVGKTNTPEFRRRVPNLQYRLRANPQSVRSKQNLRRLLRRRGRGACLRHGSRRHRIRRRRLAP